MRTQLYKLTFAIAMLVFVLIASPPLAAQYFAGYCYCFREDLPSDQWYINAYIYTYPWVFVDQASRFGEFTFLGNNAGPQQCNAFCELQARDVARALCNQYGNANHHAQWQYWWHWEDPNFPELRVTNYVDSGPNNVIFCGTF